MDVSQYDRQPFNELVKEDMGERCSAVKVFQVESSQLSESKNEVISRGVVEGIELGSLLEWKNDKDLAKIKSVYLLKVKNWLG